MKHLASKAVLTATCSFACLLGFAFAHPPYRLTAHTHPTHTATDNSGVGSHAWSNPANAEDLDQVYTSVDTSAATHYLWCTDFSFTVPSGSTIDGISCKFTGHDTQVSPAVDDPLGAWHVQLITGGAINTSTDDKHSSSDPRFFASLTDITKTVGSTSDLWGDSSHTYLNVSTINASNFGVALSFEKMTASTYNEYVDQVNIRVDYTLPSGERRVALSKARTIKRLAG